MNYKTTMANIIESYEYFDYRPPLSENFDVPGSEFPIIIYNEDICTQPSRSLLVIQGQIRVLGGNPPVNIPIIDTKKIDFINNGILHLFDRIDYFVGDNKIDSIRKPGVACTMKGLVSLKNNLNYNLAGWKISDNEDCTLINKSGFFSFVIPMSLLMGFFEDYTQFLYRIPQKLIFYRTTSSCNNCFYSSEDTYEVSVKVKNIIWRVPQVKFSIAYETKVRQEILKNTTYELLFRQWLYHSISPPPGTTEYTWDVPVSYSKTKYILLAFQADKQDQLQVMNSKFDLLDLENVQVLLNNNVYYPRERLNLKFSENKCGNLYHMFKSFRESYYPNCEADPLVSYKDFLQSYPICVVDCSHQPSVIKESLINIKIIFNWRGGIPEKTVIHCLMFMDHKAIYNPLNNKVLH